MSAPALRVLIVDDNPDAAEAAGWLLEIEGHAVDICHDGRTALAWAAERPYDALLLDLGMPSPSGYEVAAEICRRQGGTRPTLIAVTGFGQPEDRSRAVQAGFDFFQVKPLDVVRLKDQLRVREPMLAADVSDRIRSPVLHRLLGAWRSCRGATSLPTPTALLEASGDVAGDRALARLEGTPPSAVRFVMVGSRLAAAQPEARVDAVWSVDDPVCAGRVADYLAAARSREPVHAMVRWDFGDGPEWLERLVVPVSDGDGLTVTHLMAAVALGRDAPVGARSPVAQ